MKKFIQFSIIIFSASLILLCCSKDKPLTSEGNPILTTAKGQLFVVDTMNSKIEWKGYKIFKTENTSHFGTLKLESGDLTVNNNVLESGKFIVDMNTLTDVDLKDDINQLKKLNTHLKSGDFFEVEKFPTSSFEITKITKSSGGDYNTIIDGNLTIKGVTKPTQFNANLTVKDNSVIIATEPKDINREDYGVKFQLPIANGVVDKVINIQIFIKAIEKK